ncbi:MAG: hypothetical protein JWP96_207 [Polaromonas sp.]|nr:hypothetical protein [Polaromonas sp.]
MGCSFTESAFASRKFVEDGTVRNASNPEYKTEAGGVVLAKACRGGYPFAIPKTGYDVMWNKQINYAPTSRNSTTNWLVDALGNPLITSVLATYRDNLNYFGGDARENTDAISNITSLITGPSRIAGSAQGQMDFLNPLKMPRRAFIYFPGQRRVRMAPKFSYDTSHASLGGSVLYDDIYLFVGAMDRFDFKRQRRRCRFQASCRLVLAQPGFEHGLEPQAPALLTLWPLGAPRGALPQVSLPLQRRAHHRQRQVTAGEVERIARLAGVPVTAEPIAEPIR